LIGIGQSQEKKKVAPNLLKNNKTKQQHKKTKYKNKSHQLQNEIWKREDKNTSVWQSQTSISILSFPMR